MLSLHLQLFLVFALFYGCSSQTCTTCSDLATVPDGYEKVTYNESSQYLENPNRGFTAIFEGRASAWVAITVDECEWYRESQGLTSMWRSYILDTFVTTNLTDEFLGQIRADMEATRTAKFTLIIRFMYTDKMPADGKSPYGDATKEQILTHIDQLAPIFKDYDDVIDIVQVGFIGVWGDWYYTTDFGAPEDRVFQSPNIDGLTPQQWQDRKDVLTAHLDNLPDTIAVSVRTPRFKTVLYNEAATTEAERTGRTDKGRVGHHNNAFVTSSTDSGTYQCKLTEYRYLRVDTQQVPIGGETYCKSYNEPFDRYKCPTATREMRQLHYSYFNTDSNTDVMNSWRADGCLDGIRLSLGYRLVLRQAVLPVSAEKGGKFCFRLELENVGYAAPYKAKTLNIMLRDKTSGQLYSVEMDDDVMGWLPGETIVVDNAANMPSDIPAGTYEMLLVIKDKAAPEFSDYNILLASDGVPEPRQGLNNLKHDLVVSDTVGKAEAGCSYIATVVAQPDSNYTRVHNFITT